MAHSYSGVTIEEFVAHFFSRPFNEEIARRLPVQSREEISRKEDEESIQRAMETVVPKGTVPRAVLGLLGVRQLIFVEEHKYRRGSSTIEFRTVPNVFPGRAEVKGTIRFAYISDGRLERTIDGEVRVGVLGIGRIVERVIRDNVVRANETIAEVMEEWLKKHTPQH